MRFCLFPLGDYYDEPKLAFLLGFESYTLSVECRAVHPICKCKNGLYNFLALGFFWMILSLIVAFSSVQLRSSINMDDEDDHLIMGPSTRMLDRYMDSDSDDENPVPVVLQPNRISDSSSADARQGKDIQGIPWKDISVGRKKYRETRLEQYNNYENVPNSGKETEKLARPAEKGDVYYEFHYNCRSIKPTILHFQLRNLVWATSKHDVYLMSQNSVIHWSALTLDKSVIVDFKRDVVPCEKLPGNLLEGFSYPQISTIAVKDNLLVAGGNQGELICKFLDRQGITFCHQITYEDFAITNAIEFFDNSSGAAHFLVSNNDHGVRDFDVEKFQLCNHFQFEWPINHTSLSPNRKLIVVVGDDCDGLLVDTSSGKTVHTLKGHLDYSFASAWHPDGQTFATGNQDMTCRIWDARKPSESLTVLRGNLGAIRSVRYSTDGKFLAMAEPADFVHIFDVGGGGYRREQEVDFFGEISGISFSPDDEAFFIGVFDPTYGSILQYKRLLSSPYLDSFI